MKFPAAYSGCRGCVTGMFSNSSSFFGGVILRHLMVVGMLRWRHRPVRFRTRFPRISTFSNLCNSLSDATSFVLQAVTDPLSTRKPPYRCTHRRKRGEAQDVRKLRNGSPDEGCMPSLPNPSTRTKPYDRCTWKQRACISSADVIGRRMIIGVYGQITNDVTEFRFDSLFSLLEELQRKRFHMLVGITEEETGSSFFLYVL